MDKGSRWRDDNTHIPDIPASPDGPRVQGRPLELGPGISGSRQGYLYLWVSYGQIGFWDVTDAYIDGRPSSLGLDRPGRPRLVRTA